MNEADIYASRGPVSSMPGSSHSLPDGSMCMQHEDRPAVRRIQGETDSFGCEYVLMCQDCVDEHHAYQKAEYEKERYCDWCKCMKKHVSQHRDFEEGSAGPMYDVCKDCRDKESKALREEHESSSHYGLYDGYDDFFDDEDDGSSDWNNGDGHGADLHHDPATDDEARGIAEFFSSSPQPPQKPVVTYKRVRRLER